MRLTWKWLIWFLGIGIYVMCLGGIFYYNLFKWTFDERLKQESITMISCGRRVSSTTTTAHAASG